MFNLLQEIQRPKIPDWMNNFVLFLFCFLKHNDLSLTKRSLIPDMVTSTL